MPESAYRPAQSASEPMGPLVRRLDRLAFIVGSIGLLAAMSTDALAVLGRHIGVPVLGSIEIVQASVVLLASAAMVGATLRLAHARVHLLVDRFGPAGRGVLESVADLLGVVVFLAFAAGSIWISAELWHGHEHTEILGISLRWLRLFWIASALTIAGLLLAKALKRASVRR